MKTIECKLQKIITGNTLIVVNRYGVTLIHFEDDGKFCQVGQQGQSSSGTWRVSDEYLFFIVTTLPEGIEPKEFSLDMRGRTYGSTWSAMDPHNGLVAYKFEEGHSNFKL